MRQTALSGSKTQFEFTLAEQWVIHASLLDYIDVATRDDTEFPAPIVEISVLEAVEAGDYAFTTLEKERIQRVCECHASFDETVPADRRAARSVIEKIEHSCGTAE